jgi:membrane protease YdiL (CAAX protease family)
MEYLGFGTKFAWIAPPVAVIAILFAQQMASRKKWSLYFKDMIPMTLECILLAIPLIVFSLFLNSPAAGGFDFTSSDELAAAANNSQIETILLAASDAGRSLWADIITGIGAGIYEELIFRLILICLLMIIFQDILRIDKINSIILSILISAALFSASHHVDFLSGQLNQHDPFSFTKFLFRVIAGVYFAVLFAIRGFGITAATHAFYDIIAVLINAAFFEP